MGVPRSCVRACKGKCNWPCSCFYRAVNCRVALCICKSNIKMHIPVQKVSDLIKIQIFKTLQRLNFNLTEYNKRCMFFLYGCLSFYFHQRGLDLEFFDENLKYIYNFRCQCFSSLFFTLLRHNSNTGISMLQFYWK